MDRDKTPAVAECHGERLQEVEKKDIIAKHKYMYNRSNTLRYMYNMYYGELSLAERVFAKGTHKSTETAMSVRYYVPCAIYLVCISRIK